MNEEKEKLWGASDGQELQIMSEEDEVLDTDEKILNRWEDMMGELEMFCNLEKEYGPDTTIGEIRKKYADKCTEFMYEYDLESDW